MKNKYSFSEFVKTVYSFVVTKLTMPKARLVRRPIYIRGVRSISGAEKLTVGRFCRFDLDGTKNTLFIGEGCEFGDMTHIVAHGKVEIGNNVLIASKCFISDTNHGNYKNSEQSTPKELPGKRRLFTGSVKIGDNVWIGENAVILNGSVIGNGCIIGANSLVNRSFPDNCMICGSPARIVKIWDESTGKWVRKNE